MFQILRVSLVTYISNISLLHVAWPSVCRTISSNFPGNWLVRFFFFFFQEFKEPWQTLFKGESGRSTRGQKMLKTAQTCLKAGFARKRQQTFQGFLHEIKELFVMKNDSPFLRNYLDDPKSVQIDPSECQNEPIWHKFKGLLLVNPKMWLIQNGAKWPQKFPNIKIVNVTRFYGYS